MGNAVLYVFFGLEALFVVGGIMLLVIALTTNKALTGPQNTNTIANTLLISKGPINAAIANAVFIFLSFLLCIPALTNPLNRLFLKLHAYAVTLCAVFTLVLGLEIWFQTLNTGANLATLWANQTLENQSLLQQRFVCCGYRNATTPPFIPDNICTNQLVAANLQGCVGPFSQFANSLLSLVFTADFGIVAIDALLLLSIACLLKDRKEKARYKLIDAKTGFAPI